MNLPQFLREVSCYADEVKAIYEQVYRDTRGKNRDLFYDRDSQSENLVRKKDYCIMMFFDGRFDRVLTVGMLEGYSTIRQYGAKVSCFTEQQNNVCENGYNFLKS